MNLINRRVKPEDLYVVTRAGDGGTERIYGPLPRNDGEALYELILRNRDAFDAQHGVGWVTASVHALDMAARLTPNQKILRDIQSKQNNNALNRLTRKVVRS